MSFFYRLGSNPVRLFLAAQILLLISFASREFPITIFIAFAPLLALADQPSALKDSYLPFLVSIVTALVLYYAMQQSMQGSSVLSWIIYFTALALIFAAYILLQRWTNNRLNKFSLILFIMGLEYLLLKLMAHYDPVFLADFLRFRTSWTQWNSLTGYTGASFWILLSNLTFYQAVFKKESINWPLCFLTILIIVTPIVYSSILSSISLSKNEMLEYYSTNENYNAVYRQTGELISRTGAWVSLLIIIFTLTKGLTKKR